MSRTRKGSKNSTREFWSKRPGNKHGAVPGKLSKQVTKGKERMLSKELVKKERDRAD